MANYLHRTTKQYTTSVDPNSLTEPEANYVVNPDVSAVIGQPTRYWIITGDVITLMTQVERDAVDATVLSRNRDSLADEIDLVESYTKAFALLVLDEINILRAQHSLPARTPSQLKTALRNKLDL